MHQNASCICTSHSSFPSQICCLGALCQMFGSGQAGGESIVMSMLHVQAGHAHVVSIITSMQHV